MGLTRSATRTSDAGSVLLLVLIVTLTLSIMTVGLATYVSTALRASRVTDARGESAAAATAAVQWQIEELTHKRAVPCTGGATIKTPALVSVDSSTTTLRCDPTPTVLGHPTALLTARTTSKGTTMVVKVRVQVPTTEYLVRILAWTVTPGG